MTAPGAVTARVPAAPVAAGVPWALAAAAVGCQVAYPLVDGPARDRLTVLTVCLGFAAALAHAARHHGTGRAGVLFCVTLGLAGAVEVAGVHTGVPFGRYAYGDSLGPTALGVPVVVPLAWAMTAYPALVVARRLVARPAAVAVAGGWALASWDVFLDPQMVAAGHWSWADPTPALPGAPGIPLTNYAGWLAVSIVLMALLDRVLGRRGPGRRGEGGRADLLPGLLYLWTYGSQVLANLAFFGRPALALVGGVLMGLVAVPYARTLRR